MISLLFSFLRFGSRAMTANRLCFSCNSAPRGIFNKLISVSFTNAAKFSTLSHLSREEEFRLSDLSSGNDALQGSMGEISASGFEVATKACKLGKAGLSFWKSFQLDSELSLMCSLFRAVCLKSGSRSTNE